MSIAALADEEIIQTEGALMRQAMAPAVADVSERITRRLELNEERAAQLKSELKADFETSPGGPQPPQKTKASSALDALTRFIPTEAVTLYIAAVAAMPALEDTFNVTKEGVYWFCAALTPILLFLIIFGKRRSLKWSGDPKYKELPVFPGWRKWPWFKFFAATVAFLVWALAVEGSPYFEGVYAKMVAAFGALVVSTFLTLLEPLLSRKAP